MKLTTTQVFDAPREKVFAALNDPEILRKSIEGCEKLTLIGEDSYEAQLKIGLGAIKGSYKGKVQIKDKVEPESFTLVIEGKGGPGFVRSTAKVRLSANGDRTELHAEAEATVGGLIAAVGSRLVEGAARKMMADFFQKFGSQL